MKKELWVRADLPEDKAERKDLVTSALESGISKAIVRPEDADFASLGSIELLFNEEGRLSNGCIIAELRTPEDQEEVLALAGRCAGVVLAASDWTIIPLENMIARFRNTGTRVYACASDTEQARLYMNTLEVGVDGVAVQVGDPNGVRAFAEMASGAEGLDLGIAEIVAVRNVEMGDRVCVDTVTNMVQGEGMLIGSQSACLFLVQSESEDNGYVAARPFRVNAGAVHAYVQGPEGRTRYLSELRSGDPVLLVDRSGNTRMSSVGRCKIERRPMMVVEAEADGQTYSTIVQNAETVKMVGPEGAISVSKLQKGDRVLVRIQEGGRHFGMKVDETVREI
ncbi:MAG: 3-dehydroquinate synthase II [Candidatus Methanomethylophilaceae archaeon]|jgi:3-dehydroquinate synthase II|nr:3-dehydroquinate synthase II [Candidatus Methanomethylophilaceae archaeon]